MMGITNQEELFDQFSLGITPGDCVYIKGALCNHRLVEDLALYLWKMGALPYFSMSSFSFENLMMQENNGISIETLQNIPMPLSKLYENTDHLMIIEPIHDPYAHIFDEEKFHALELKREKLYKKAKNITRIDTETIKLSWQQKTIQDPEDILRTPITPFKIKKVASLFIDSLSLENGNFISIKGGLHAQRLLEEIALEGLRNGIHSLIHSTSDYYKINFLGDPSISCATMEKEQLHETEMMTKIDARILIDPVENPVFRDKIKTGVDIQKRNTKLANSRMGWLDDVRKKKYIYSAYPTLKQAKSVKIPYKELEQIIIDGICSSEGVRIVTNAIAERLKDATKLMIKDELGTDFWVSAKDRKMYVEAGEITEENHYINFPCGEVAYPVVETTGEGTIFSPIAADFVTKKPIHDLQLSFKGGKIINDSIECRSDEEKDYFIRGLDECIREDEKRGYDPIRTTNVAELGIGTNAGIHRAINAFFDEKMLGTVHLAFGGNEFLGGTSRSMLHVDLVTSNKITLEVEYSNGSKSMIFKKGKYQPIKVK